MAVERRRDFDASCDLMLPISAVVLNPGGVDISWERVHGPRSDLSEASL